MKKILGLVVLSLFAINASAADLLASSAAPTVTQNIVVEGAACPGVGATGFSSTGLLLSCQSGVWKSSGGGAPNCLAVRISGYSSNDVTTYACPTSYTKTGWDTTGSGWRSASSGGHVIGQNDYATIFCCRF